MDDEEETPEKARARKAAAEAWSDLFPTKKRMKFQICPGSDEIQRPTPPEQITAIAMSDRPPPSDRGGGRREGPETPPVRESSNKKKTEPQRGMGVAAIKRLRLPLQEITESNHPMQAAPRLQRRLEIAELERLKLLLEEKQKQSLGITGSNRPMQTKTPGTDEIERPKQMKAIATSDRPPPSDRGGGRREGPETPLVRESPKKKKKVPQRGMGIAALERLQMEEERKKKITASNRLLQAPPRSLELSSSQNEFRLQKERDPQMIGSGSGEEETNVIDFHGLGSRGVLAVDSEEERKKNLRMDGVKLPLQEITTFNRPVQALPPPLGHQNQNERRLVPIYRSEFRLQKKTEPQMNGSGSGKEETNVIDSHGLGNGGVRTFHSAALRWQSLMEITEFERLRLQKEERKKKLRIDDVELPLQEITTSNRPVQAPPWPRGRQNQNERPIVPVDRSEVRLQPKNPRNNEIQPSKTITTSDPFLQTTPIFSDQGLGGLKHTLGGIVRRRVTADRFWQNLQGFLRDRNDGAPVISDQTLRIAEPSDGQDKRPSPEDQIQPGNTE